MTDRTNRVLSSWLLERKVIGDRIRLYVGVTVVGRQPGSALCIDSNYVSRKHAVITVDKNGQIILKDLNSINGTFVNGTKTQNGEIILNANDCIGVGVTDDSKPDLEHPIYKLIYAPLPRTTTVYQDHSRNEEKQSRNLVSLENVRAGNPNFVEKKGNWEATVSSASTSAVMAEIQPVPTSDRMEANCTAAEVSTPNNIDVAVSDINAKASTSAKAGGNINSITGIRPKIVDTIGAVVSKSDETSLANSSTAPTSSNGPTLYSGAIIVLSDDEDDILHPIKKEFNPSSDEKNDKGSSGTTDQNNCTKSNQVPLSKSSSSNTWTTEKVTNPTPHTPNDAVLHEPILPEVKREFVRSCTKNIVEIFGGPDDVILETAKEINPLLYTKLNGKITNKTLYDGDSIDLLTDNEDDDGNIAQNVETFGELIPAVEENQNCTKNKDAEFKNVISNEAEIQSKNLVKSPNLFDNSLNSSNEEEQRNANIGENKISEADKDIENMTVESANNADELAEFVDMDDDMMFSQILINDIKSEMMAGNNEEEVTVEDEPLNLLDRLSQDDHLNIHIKKEVTDNKLHDTANQKPNGSEIENDVWITIDDDDEDYDEEFEHKVSDWSTKLLSQKMNISQVFDFQNDKAEDLDENNKNAELACDSEDLDDIFNEALVDDVIATLAQKNGEIKNDLKSPALEQRSSKDSSSDNDDERNKEILQRKEEPKSNEELSEKKSNASLVALKELKTTTITSSKNLTRDEKDSGSVSKETTTSKEKIMANMAKKDVVKPVKRLHHPPSVIEAPNLPKNKGKHRGVSAELRSVPPSTKHIRKMAAAISGQLKDERYRDELKNKWFEKPADQRRRENEKKRQIKESRKERLKELADKQSAETKKELLKRKHTPEPESGEKKKAKVKITTMNRAALLAEDIGAVKKTVDLYKIPKIKKSSTVTTKKHREPSTSATATGTASATQSKADQSNVMDAFAQEMNKVDKIICRRSSSSNSNRSLSRSSSVDETKDGNLSAETKLCNAPARKANKITFASMQKNFIENRKNAELLHKFAIHRSCLINVMSRDQDKDRQKKRVRFNETPVVHFIERVNGANKRVDRKDILPSPTCADRAHMVRLAYAMVDKTAQIISQILGWSNDWLVNRNAQVDAASDILLPMPNQFSTFNHYKSIIIPLMKLEFISVLEREKTRCKTKSFTISADQVTPYMDRFIIMGRYAGVNTSDSKSELVVLEWGKFTTFAYMSSKRVGFNTTTIVYEVLAKYFSLEELRANVSNPVKVRPMIDIVRVEFGAFNAVYQLEQSPLLKQILDPMQLCKLKPLPKSSIQYCGFDELNDCQKNALIRTYRRAIEPTPNITLIQGPPGTGKSCVIANLVHQLLYGNEIRILDQKVLVCAQSNAAVDVIAEKLLNMTKKKLPDVMFRLIRFGLMDRINPNVWHATLPKIIERNQLRKLRLVYKNIQIDDKIDVKDYLRNQIVQLEAAIEHMQQKNVKGTVQEDELLESVRQAQLMRNIVNGVLRPEDERSLYNWHLKNANVVCTTLSSCVKLSQYVNYFDVCIIDEATQCTEPWTLMPLKFGINTLVLVGDTQQLPATVLSKKASDFGLGTSLFTRIQRCIESVNLKNIANGSNPGEKLSASDNNDIIFSLKTQYRMHPEICKWPNSYFYQNKLIDDPKTQQFKTPLKPFSVLNLIYTQDENCHRGQIANELEAKFVARLVKTLDGYIPMKYNTYGVITPYAQHREALEKALRNSGFPNVMVNTIDSYQGMERDVIIISNARTTGIGFLANYQRLNVALTRPKKCLILCGNFKNLVTVPAWRSLLSSARERKLYHELSANCMDDMHRNVIPKIKISKEVTTQVGSIKEPIATNQGVRALVPITNKNVTAVVSTTTNKELTAPVPTTTNKESTAAVPPTTNKEPTGAVPPITSKEAAAEVPTSNQSNE